ncbi:MAG: UDP-N-acetylglucosamine 1-carboxyvinyltransferase, partial [Clostridia bacterium]|nr:UDP-N-acetylglucosamine 1-carboxyvinyltransferase [Clostridia bacterium]
MKTYIVEGGRPLCGTVSVSGAKNAALPILFATLLVEGRTYLEGIPEIRDTALAISILRSLGADCIAVGKGAYVIDTQNVRDAAISADMAGGMRASSYLLGALLARFGHSKLPLPGGCNLGERPIDLHLKSLSALGADVQMGEGFVEVSADLLCGADFSFDTVSVGATVNALLAATAARGKTVLKGVSCEPHITDLVRFLKKCGATIEGEGSATLTVYGGKPLCGSEYTVMADVMEAGTYLIAGAATGGEVTVKGVCPLYLSALCRTLKEAGALFSLKENTVSLRAPDRLCG